MSTVRDLRELWDRGRAVVSDAVNRYRTTHPVEPATLDRLRELRELRETRSVSQDRLAAICSSLALRDLNLVDLAIEQLEKIYQHEEDPDKLEHLYQIDNLAIRMRRNAENLRVLAGQNSDDAAADSASLVDLLRAALSSIRQHERVALGQVAPVAIVGPVAADIGRVVTELLDNAANNSPPASMVRVNAYLTETASVLLRIEDDGIGLPDDRLAGLNQRLSGPSALDRDAVRHMGLAVVASLAHQHKMRVRLQRRVPQGTTALVTIPDSLVTDLPTALWSGGNTVSGTPRSSQPEGQPAPRHRASDDGPTGNNGSRINGARPEPPAERPAPLGELRREPVVGGLTPSGLPKRVPASLRAEAGPRDVTDDMTPSDTGIHPAVDTDPEVAAEAQAEHVRAFAEFGAFELGQRTADTGEEATELTGDLGDPDQE